MNLDDKDPVEEPIVEAAEGTEEISEEVLEKISSEDSGVTLITAEDQAADDEEVEEQPEEEEDVDEEDPLTQLMEGSNPSPYDSPHDEFDWELGAKNLLTYDQADIDKYLVDYEKSLTTLDENVVVTGKVTSFSCLLYTSPSPRDRQKSRMPSSA